MLPFSAALIAAFWVELTVRAEAVKLALLDPAGTVTTEGTVTTVLPVNTTFSPPVGAAELNVTVQVAFEGVTNDEGVQVRVLTVTAGGCHPDTVIVPPAPDTEAMVPSARAPKGLVTPTGTEPELVAEAKVAVATATTPAPIGVEFMPVARHFTWPLAFWQEMLFPAAVSADPAATLTDVTSDGEKDRVHSIAEGPLVVLIDRFNGSELPAAEEPDARLKLVCAQAEFPSNNAPKAREM